EDDQLGPEFDDLLDPGRHVFCRAINADLAALVPVLGIPLEPVTDPAFGRDPVVLHRDVDALSDGELSRVSAFLFQELADLSDVISEVRRRGTARTHPAGTVSDRPAQAIRVSPT